MSNVESCGIMPQNWNQWSSDQDAEFGPITLTNNYQCIDLALIIDKEVYLNSEDEYEDEDDSVDDSVASVVEECNDCSLNSPEQWRTLGKTVAKCNTIESVILLRRLWNQKQKNVFLSFKISWRRAKQSIFYTYSSARTRQLTCSYCLCMTWIVYWRLTTI